MSQPHEDIRVPTHNGAPRSLAAFVDELRELPGQAERLHVHDPEGPRECVVRPGELVTTVEAVAAVTGRLGRWVDGVDQLAAASLVRIRLKATERERCVPIAAEFDRQVEVAPNHVHFGAPVLFGTPVIFGTGATPEPVPAPQAPPDDLWEPRVSAAVLDTGLDPHPWFAGRPWLSEWGLATEVLDADGVAGQDRQAGHGTFITGVLLRGAPGVTIRHHRALASTGISDDVIVARAMRRIRQEAAAHGAHLDIVLLACGCYTADDRCPLTLRRELSRFRDCIIVAAAGNGGGTRPFWPAADKDVLAVAATDRDGVLAAFSNRGEWVDAAAPGVDVVSSYVNLSISDGVFEPGGGERWYGTAAWSGTSFAVPSVAAEVATALRSGSDSTRARAEVCARMPVPGRS